MALQIPEHESFLFNQFSSEEDFEKQYKKTYHGKEEGKDFYVLLLNKLKTAILQDNLDTFKKLINIFNYVNAVESPDLLKKYYACSSNPIINTNLIILSCKHNKPQILKCLLANDITLKNLSRNVGKMCIVPEEEDETSHNSFYYVLSSGNIELIEVLINNWPNNYFAIHCMELDDILSKSYEELKLRNVPLSCEIEIFVETKLLNIRFYSNSNKQTTVVKDYEHNIRERAKFVCENISLLKKEYLRAKDVDETFLHVVKSIAQNLHVLKRRMKSTYISLPWEEVEFCLISFVSSHMKEQEINLFYSALLNKNKILSYLEIFSQKLKEIMENEDISKLNVLPKFKRDKIIAEIKKHNPQFEDLYNTHQQIRDIHSLQKINDYVKLALLVDSKAKEGQLIIIRVLQVIGEYLKNTLESPKLSGTTSGYLLLLLPKNTREIIVDLRNSLSHAHSLNKRTEIEEHADVTFFKGIQNDTKKVGDAIADILHTQKMKIIRMLLRNIMDSNNLAEMKEVTKPLKNIELDPISSVNFKMLEHQKLEKLVEELDNIVLQKTNNMQYLFHNVKKNLKIFEEKNTNVKMDYIMGYASLKSFTLTLNDDKIDNYFITGMKCRAFKTLKDISPHLDPDYLQDIAELTRNIFCTVKSKIPEDNLEKIYRIIWEIFYIIEFEVGDIKWIEELREKINEKCFMIPTCKQNAMTRKSHDEQLQAKINELKSILSRNLLDSKLIQNYPSYKDNKKLQALVEMLVLDIMSILGSKNYLENSFLNLDDSSPLLTGKYLRNHLVHYNDLVDLLLSDPSIAVILNAKKLVSENIANNNKKIGKLVSDNPLKLEHKLNQDLFIIDNQQKMFNFLEDGNLEGFKSCLNKGADIFARNINLWTSLHFAAKGPNLEILKFVVNQNFDITVKNIDNQTSLHIAASYGRKHIVEFLIKLGLQVDDKDRYELTALHLAAKKGHKDTVITLLHNKANAFAIDSAGLLPLYYAIRNDHIEVVKILLKKGVNINIYEALGGFSLLHEAAESGHVEIANILLQKGANVNAKNDRNWTPLHAAARNGYKEMVNALILHGADVKATVINGCSSLHYAAENGHKDIVNILLKHGANMNAPNEGGEIPLHSAVKCGCKNVADILLNKKSACMSNNEGLTSLHFAVQGGHYQIVVDIIAYVDANVKSKNGCTPLHYAAEKNRVKIANLLIKHGALVNTKTCEGLTALHIGTSKGHQDIINFLIESKAEIDAKDKEGLTPLHTAVVKKNTDIIDLLIKGKADIDARSTHGFTPLHLAALNGLKDVVDLLIQNRAKVNSSNSINRTPLHDAIMYGHKDIAEVLIKHKADVNAKDTMDVTPLHIAAESGHKDIINILIANGANINVKTKNNHTPLILAVKHNYVDIVEIFLRNGINVNIEGREPLLAAVYAGFVHVVEVFLKHDASVNTIYENMTLLHVAACKGQKEIVNKLLSKGAKVNILNNYKETPLYTAAQEGYAEIVEILVAKGCSVIAVNDEGWTPLHISAAKGHINVVKFLVDKNKAILNLRDYQNRTAIEVAVANGHLQVVKILLECKEIDINSKGDADYTILHIAAQENRLDIVKYLLSKGAFINAENSSGSKPIHIAAREGNKDIVEFLLSKGCSINDLGSCKQNILFYAAMKGHLELLNYLISQGANVNAMDTTMLRPLHIAALFGYNDIIKALLKNGAIYNVVDKNNRKPINVTRSSDTKNLLASTANLFDAVKSNSIFLVKNYIKDGAYVNAKNLDDSTPLHYAACEGYNEIVFVLLQNKANVNSIDSKGCTPLYYAAEFSHLQVVKALLCNGAIYNAVSDTGKMPLDVTVNKSIATILELVSQSFQCVENDDSKVIINLHKIKDIDTVKAVMNARNIDNRSLIVTAMHNNFERIEELKNILQDDVSSKINTALIMLNQDNYQGSLNIFKNVLEKRKEILGADNPGSLDIQMFIAKILFKQGAYENALNMLEEIFQKQKEMLGLNAKDTLSTRNVIALVLHTQGKDKEALFIYRDVHMRQKKILGNYHTDTLETQLHMALVLDRLEKYEEALNINQEVYKKRNESNHPAALLAQNNIAMVLSHQEKYDEALKVYNEVLKKKKVLFGINSSDTIRTLHNIAEVLFNQKKYYESLETFQKVLNIRKDILGPYHPDTLMTQYGLGSVLFAQKKWNSALKTFKEGLEQRKLIWGSNHPTILDILTKIKTIKLCITMEGGNATENYEPVQTDIYKAAIVGDIQTVQKLLKNGAEINDKNSDGRTILHLAVNSGHIGTIIALLKSGADATLLTDKGNTPLHTATLKGFAEVVEVLLQNLTCDELRKIINVQTFTGGTTALHVAAGKGFREIVTSLLKHGAIFNIKNREGKIPMHLAKDQNIINLLKLVGELFEDIKNGNDNVINKLKVLEKDELLAAINARDNYKKTLLQVSITYKHKNISRGILEILKKV